MGYVRPSASAAPAFEGEIRRHTGDLGNGRPGFGRTKATVEDARATFRRAPPNVGGARASFGRAWATLGQAPAMFGHG